MQIVGFEPNDSKATWFVFNHPCAFGPTRLVVISFNEVDGVLIMDCNAVLLKTAEGMGDLYKSIGLQASRRLLYSGPQKKSLDDWRKLYNFRSSAQLKP